MSGVNGQVLNGTDSHDTSHSTSGSDSHSASHSTGHSTSGKRARAFQRAEDGKPDDMVQIRVRRALLDAMYAERDRIEPPNRKPRSGEFYAGKVFEAGLEWLRTVEPVHDPLA